MPELNESGEVFLLNLRTTIENLRRPLLLYIAVASYAAAPVSASGYDFLETGTNYYRQGNYLAASAALNWAVEKAPNNANAHYLLANSLVKLGRFAEAGAQYQAAISVSKERQLRSYCQAALNQLSLAPAIVGLPGQVPGLGTQPQPPYQAAPLPGAPGVRPTIQNTMHQQAGSAIDRQANMTSESLLNDANANAASWQRTGAYLSEQQRIKGEQTARAMERTKFSGTNGSIYSPEEIAAARTQGQVMGDMEAALAQERSQRAVQFAKAKVWETQAAALNLQDQLNARSVPGGAKLKAEGTNLYVRNFESNPATPEKALSAGEPGKLRVYTPLVGTPNSLENPGSKTGGTARHLRVESTVHGQVVP